MFRKIRELAATVKRLKATEDPNNPSVKPLSHFEQAGKDREHEANAHIEKRASMRI